MDLPQSLNYKLVESYTKRAIYDHSLYEAEKLGILVAGQVCF